MKSLRDLSTTFFAFYLGCMTCFLCQTQWGFTPIFASSLLGVLVTFVPFPSGWDQKSFQIIFCTGTFAAMSSREILAVHWHVVAISAVGALFYTLAKPHFVGFGGKMGAMAFVTTAIWLLARVWA